MGFHVLVLAGGSGTRLWPLSRGSTPKHLLPLAPGGRTLLGDTVERVASLADQVHIVTADSQVAACRSALLGLPQVRMIAEPAARGTGPALALAVATIARDDPEALIASVHADARVTEPDAFRVALLAAAGWAEASGGLATVGLTPTTPATGFGYIELGAACDPAAWRRPPGPAAAALLGRAAGLEAHRAVQFVEKPDRATAERYLADGRHLWNLALFAWRASVFLHELRSAAPDVADAVQRVVERRIAGDEAEAMREYTELPVAPVEPLLLERGAPLTAVRAAFPWSDVGSWSDLHDARADAGEADADDNVVDGDVLTVGARGSTVVARGNRLVAVVGADSLVVVDTPDALLVVPADRAQLVKDAVSRLRDAGRTDVL